MIKLAANLSFLFTEVPFLDRFEAAAKAGFTAVEYLFPYEYDSDQILARLQKFGLQQVLFNLPAGDWAAGERGIACHPGREAEFLAGLELALPLTKKLGVCRLHCLAGLTPAGVADADCRRTLLANLKIAADAGADAGVKILIEPINSRIDMPGYWLDTPQKALALLAELQHPNLALQYDIYHAHVMGNDVVATLPALLPSIAHIQLADYPGRHQPGSGEIPFEAIFQCLLDHHYTGWVGCEYRPLQSTETSLNWAVKWLRMPTC